MSAIVVCLRDGGVMYRASTCMKILLLTVR